MEHNLFLYFVRVVVHAFASYHNCTGSIPLMVSAPDVQKPLRFFEIFHKDLMILYFPIIKVEI